MKHAIRNSKTFLKLAIIIGALCICYAMGQLLIPFILGLILAYTFHYPTEQLSKYLKLSPAVSAGVVVLFIISIFIFFSMFIIPLIKTAAVVILKECPSIISKLPDAINSLSGIIEQKLGLHISSSNLSNTIAQSLYQFTSDFPQYILGFLNTSITLVYIIMFAFMTPIITFYLLKDWHKIKHYTIMLLNKFSSQTSITILNQINNNLGKYIIGQSCVCLTLGFIYTIALLIIGLDSYIMCGLFSGIMSFAPFFGPLIALITTSAVATSSYVHLSQYVITALLYMVIPFIDANFLTPKLIGKKVGIQPFWLLFSICATISMLGFSGIFIAVPVAIVLSTVCKYLVQEI